MTSVTKRIFDFFGALFGLVLLSPLIVLISLIVLFTEGAPIFFRQERIGLNGKVFLMTKFRTMKIRSGSETGDFDAGDSSRVTWIGKYLRKSKIDELPQLFNVLIGDMSLVGPRPEVRKWVNEYPERWSLVHTVRPGITDPASIKYRDEEYLLSVSNDPEKVYREDILPNKLDLYEEYVNNYGLWSDIRIILRTLVVLLYK